MLRSPPDGDILMLVPQAWVALLALSSSLVAQASSRAATPVVLCDVVTRTIAVLDPDSGALTRAFRTEDHPRNAILSPDGKRVFVANTGWVTGISSAGELQEDARPGTVSVFLLSDDGQAGAGSPGGGFVGPSSPLATIRVGVHPYDLELSPDGRTLYVSNLGSSTVSVIDVDTLEVARTIPVRPMPHGIALDASGSTLYVTSYFLSAVLKVDVASGATTDIAPVPSGPRDVRLSSTGSLVVVASSDSDTVTVLDAKSLTPVHKITVPGFPYKLAGSPNHDDILIAGGHEPRLAILRPELGTVIIEDVPEADGLGDLASNEEGDVFAAAFARGSVSKRQRANGEWSLSTRRGEIQRALTSQPIPAGGAPE
jgi:YVTN family beta-propeller protein